MVALLFFGMFTLSNAEVPKLINYQGHLTDKGGNPLTGTYSIVFTIWDADTGGSSQWTETQSGAVYGDVKKELMVHANEELQHALTLVDQIDYLGGIPTLDVVPAKVSQDNIDMLEQALGR